MNRLAKIIICLLLLSTLGSLTALGLQKQHLTKLNKKYLIQQTQYPKVYDELNSLTLPTLKSKMDNGDTFLIYVGRPDCSDCQKFDPQLLEFLAKNNLKSKIYYVNVAKIRKSHNKWNDFKKIYKIQYTPTIAIVSHKKVVKQIGWTPQGGTDNKKIFEFIKVNAKKVHYID